MCQPQKKHAGVTVDLPLFEDDYEHKITVKKDLLSLPSLNSYSLIVTVH